MARPLEFDRETALEESMRIFWRYGYASTSIQRLSKQMCLHPGSLYGAFKSKRHLFIEALELYFQRSSQAIREALQEADSPLEGIRRFFYHLLDQIEDERAIKGCLMINTATELAEEAGDEALARRLDEMFRSHEKQFEQALITAQANGELAKDKDPAALARYLLVGVRGLRIYGKARPSRAELEGVVDNLLAVLRC
ncbi:TetR/AcrR family transcriptional regulator [Sedimenticola sp.]|uniref:TetR/AcrR family transcriptional regulator n=1 Tax=Sedimenticola sp. TaxID=1940285 RepID=UPI003D0F2979